MARSDAGFVKKHATAVAYDMRAELGLSPFERLDPLVLADYLDIPILQLSAIRAINADADQFLVTEPDAFSGLTLFDGPRRLVIHNDAHSKSRQASTICHELAHGLLFHEPGPALDATGCRDWDQVMEDQAQWVAGALLVHELALVAGLRRHRTVSQLARQLGVSEEMVAWRTNMTGARRRAA
jgi:Zn-dependent peptidase ImmA (M78 family)